MPKAAFVVGMSAEAECLAGLGFPVACSGARPALARAQAERLVAEGARALISFGLAGAQVPDLAPGALVLPRAVIEVPSGQVFPVDAAWHTRVVAAAASCGLSLVSEVTVAGSDQAVTTATDKAALARVSGAAVVDMESHVVAAVAREHRLPMLVLRAVADPADRGIPALALAGLGPDGATRPWTVARHLVMAPWALLALIRLAADSRAGLAALGGAVTRLGPAAFRPG